ncbi:unnamed protein product [Clonostachys chloroleuca]|uniref:Aminoglycoside phosphotransferase domain-containing protein n=1 Tax=Clonostachys chloroleuca TaxID=1926264 RepID=A0AA35PX22_9HYPO|nr:unnamed protein product [Clonostachys chloroleuca]
MDVSRYAANPEAYDKLAAYQITKFFNEHGLNRDEIDHFAANLLGSPVSATLVQGATSYTVSCDEVAQVVQFRHTQLPMNFIELARQLYGDFVPECKSRGMFGPVHVFFASAWINKHAHTLKPPPGLLSEYFKILDKVSIDLPPQLQERLDEVRLGLPRLFQAHYPMVLQHDDLLENNIHVDEATGHITGKWLYENIPPSPLFLRVVDWADAKIAPFGVSLASMEIVLGIQNRTDWHFHPNHHSLRQLFWDTFYSVTGHISDDDRHSIAIARLFGFFRNHGPEEKEHAIAYLSALCLL